MSAKSMPMSQEVFGRVQHASRPITDIISPYFFEDVKKPKLVTYLISEVVVSPFDAPESGFTDYQIEQAQSPETETLGIWRAIVNRGR